MGAALYELHARSKQRKTSVRYSGKEMGKAEKQEVESATSECQKSA